MVSISRKNWEWIILWDFASLVLSLCIRFDLRLACVPYAFGECWVFEILQKGPVWILGNVFPCNRFIRKVLKGQVRPCPTRKNPSLGA